MYTMKSISCFWRLCIHSILCIKDDGFTIFPRKSEQKWKFYPVRVFLSWCDQRQHWKSACAEKKRGTGVRYEMVWSTFHRQDNNGNVRCFCRMQRFSIINYFSHAVPFLSWIMHSSGKPVPETGNYAFRAFNVFRSPIILLEQFVWLWLHQRSHNMTWKFKSKHDSVPAKCFYFYFKKYFLFHQIPV